jgi:hypothetical protein
VGLADHQAHRDAHPEELGSLDALVGVTGLVDDEVAVVEGLDAEEVEVEIRGRDRSLRRGGRDSYSSSFGERRSISTPRTRFALKARRWNSARRAMPSRDDVPVEHFLVDVAEENAGGEAWRSRRRFSMRVFELRMTVLRRSSTVISEKKERRSSMLDLVAADAEVEAEHGEVDARFGDPDRPRGIVSVG